MGFTGVDDPYEPPLHPEIEVDTAHASIENCAQTILTRLRELGYLDGAVDGKTIQAQHEYLPDELVLEAEAALRKAGRVHTDVLLRELHVGLASAARLIDRLAEQGKIGLRA
jgi:DNA segregation ATPase FtsK/SpoIIIE-like protein